MNGRLRRACIRCARRTGRRDKVKFAEEKRVSAVRGGRPCLYLSIRERSRLRHWELSGSVPNKIGKRQWVQRPRGQASDLIIIDIDGCRRMRPWPLECRLVCDTHEMPGSSPQWAYDT